MSTKLMRSRPARLFNSLLSRFAGRRFFPLYGVIEHRGRRSGRIFHTVVVVRPVAEGFVVPMPWGERTDGTATCGPPAVVPSAGRDTTTR